MKLDKTEISRRQLGTALALFLEDSDPVSVHTLACAGCEIAEYLTDKAGEKPFSTHALATFPDLKIGEIRQLQNQYWNAFKHARTRGGIERKDRELLARFGDEVNDHTLFIGWYDYMLAVRLGHARIAYQRVGRQRSTGFTAVPTGIRVADVEIGPFLIAAPEKQELLRLIGTLV